MFSRLYNVGEYLKSTWGICKWDEGSEHSVSHLLETLASSESLTVVRTSWQGGQANNWCALRYHVPVSGPTYNLHVCTALKDSCNSGLVFDLWRESKKTLLPGSMNSVAERFPCESRTCLYLNIYNRYGSPNDVFQTYMEYLGPQN